MAKVAFIGLGVMGYPMAGHLARAGHEVTVYNRTVARCDAWLNEYRGQHAATPRDAVAGADFVCSCVGDDPDVLDVAGGEHGLIAGLQQGATWIDHTTASAALARELAEQTRAAGGRMLDAPVSGGQAGAEAGRLTVMLGGDSADCERVRPLLEAYAHRVVRVGDHGAGQLAKMVNQICIAGLLQGLSEGIHFAQCNGLDIERVIEAIGGGAAQSWQLDNRATTMAAGEFDFGFAVEWMRKDLRICLEQARDSGAQLPVTALVDQFYADVANAGGARLDTSSLITRLRRARGD